MMGVWGLQRHENSDFDLLNASEAESLKKGNRDSAVDYGEQVVGLVIEGAASVLDSWIFASERKCPSDMSFVRTANSESCLTQLSCWPRTESN